MREIPWNIARGFLMGAADIVPGVSGGTIALVLGIYRRLIASIRAGSSALGELIRGHTSDAVEWLRRIEWQLVVPLAAGIVLAVVALSRILETQLETAPVQMAALFFGLVAGSVLVAWRMLNHPSPQLWWLIAVATVVTFLVLGLRESTTPAETAGGGIALPVFFLSAAIAICAMILPGVSGSFLLVILGMYGPVLTAVNDRDLMTLLVFVAGAVVGLAVFSQLLHRALQLAYDRVMAVLIGLMIGSIRVLWPWPKGVESTALGAPDDNVIVAVLLAAVGFVLVLGISTVSRAHLEPAATADDAVERPQPSS